VFVYFSLISFTYLLADCREQLKTALNNMAAILCFIEKEMQRHRENFDPTCIRDFIDLYIKDSGGANRTLQSPFFPPFATFTFDL